MSRIQDRLAKILLNKKTVVTRAVFWKIPHDSGKEDIRLKLGRYKKPEDFDPEEEPEVLEPKSELTLDQEEFQALLPSCGKATNRSDKESRRSCHWTSLLILQTRSRFAACSRCRTRETSSGSS